MLSSFGDGLRAAVVGASGGIGEALVRRLAADPAVAQVAALSRRGREFDLAGVVSASIDIEDEDSIVAAAAGLREPLQLVIVATGLLHDGELTPEKDWRALDAARLLRSMRVNAIGPALVAKHFFPLLPRSGKAVFAALSARVGSIEDNRLGGWYAYRASKAALNQLLRTLSVELARKRREAVCLGLHPGTVDTALSQPFQSGVAPQKLFTPDFAAERLLAVIDDATTADSGRVIAWDGKRVPA